MKDFLSAHLDFSEATYAEFKSIGKLVHYKKSEQLIQAQKKVNKLFFITNGFIRGYRLIDGQDITHHFFTENWFATDYEAYLTGSPAELYLEAMTETTVYQFDKILFSKFVDKHNGFERLRTLLAEDAYLRIVGRLKDFQNKNLKERYNSLLERNPELSSLVPQRHIASYLGVAPQSLSRIKEASINP